jgi:Ca-activated chloride channel family protein
MDNILAAVDAFHWIRPMWLTAVPLIGMLWWLIRRRDRLQQVTEGLRLAPHLLTALTVNQAARRGVRPVDLVVIGLALAALSAAGPTWQRIPNPFFAETAPLVVAMEVSDTMLANDVLPTRLERARLKVLDLMDLRTGGRTALIAFAGTAHLVLPPAEDPRIIKPFLEGLDPDIMPRPGDNGAAALILAQELLVREDTPGSILFITDGLDSSDVPAFASYREQVDAAGIVILVLGTESGGVARRADGTVATDAGGRRLETGVDLPAIERLARIDGVSVVRSTLDNSDLTRIQRRVATNLQNALDEDVAAAWEDQGWWLLWPGALLALLWFRRGWTMQWVWVCGLGLSFAAMTPAPAAADPADWFFTPDQQARYAFEQKRFNQAADRFEDPMWKGIAAYRAGRYQEAAEVFARVPTAHGFLNAGNSYIKAREYQLAVDAFALAVAEDPEFAPAQRNLEVARYIVSYLNDLRLATDTGDESELGADAFKFDNKSGEGVEIVINDSSRLEAKSEEQWMRAVDTHPGEFLRLKFALEADQRLTP